MSTTAYQIIAVDFDGTLCYSNWPELGEPNRPLIEYLIDQKNPATSSSSGHAAPVKPWKKQSPGAVSISWNLMP